MEAHMDERVIRQQLEEVKGELRMLKDKEEVLLNLHQGLEGWLRLNAAPTPQPKASSQLSLTVPMSNGQHNGHRPHPTSWRTLVGQVLKEAHGSPLHSKEIWIRVQAKGLTTKSKNPVGSVDLTALNIPEVERAGPRQWRWAGK